MLTASQRVDPQLDRSNPQWLVWLFSPIKRLQIFIVYELNLPKPFLNIFEPWKSVFECTIVLKLTYLLCIIQSLSLKFYTRSFWNYVYILERKNLSVRYHLGIFKWGVSLEGLSKSGVPLEKCKGCLKSKV